MIHRKGKAPLWSLASGFNTDTVTDDKPSTRGAAGFSTANKAQNCQNDRTTTNAAAANVPANLVAETDLGPTPEPGQPASNITRCMTNMQHAQFFGNQQPDCCWSAHCSA